MTQKELNKRLRLHRDWVKSSGKSGEMFVGAGEDFAGLDFTGAYLRGVDFRAAGLGRVDFRGAYLRGVDFRGANLRGADFRGANLEGASLRWANFDFSAWPLHCGSFKAQVDDRLLAQLLHHVAKLDVSNCSPVVRYAWRWIFQSWAGKFLANTFCEYRNDVEEIDV